MLSSLVLQRRPPLRIKPLIDLVQIEPDETSDLVVRHPALENQTPDVANRDTESLRNRRDIGKTALLASRYRP